MLIWSEQELLLIVSSCMLKRRPDTVYRVVLSNETKLVHVISFGMEGVDVSPERVYDGVNDLPEWINSYCLTGVEPQDCCSMVEAAMAEAKDKHGGIFAVIIID